VFPILFATSMRIKQFSFPKGAKALHIYDYFKDICFLKREPPEVFYRSQLDENEAIYILENSLTKDAFTIKEPNAAVWEMLDGETCVADILQRLYSVYDNDVKKETLLADLLDFLEFLWERGFIYKAFKIPGRTEIKPFDSYG
jgi:hypothetical protein